MKRTKKILLFIIAIVSLGGELFIPAQSSHVWWHHVPVFFALLGFLGCLAIIIFAKSLGKAFLRKREDYYDER